MFLCRPIKNKLTVLFQKRNSRTTIWLSMNSSSRYPLQYCDICFLIVWRFNFSFTSQHLFQYRPMLFRFWLQLSSGLPHQINWQRWEENLCIPFCVYLWWFQINDHSRTFSPEIKELIWVIMLNWLNAQNQEQYLIPIWHTCSRMKFHEERCY